MTRDGIIAMAKEAGIQIDVLPDKYCSAVGLPSGSASRCDGVGIDEVRALIRLATAKEREACAQIADIHALGWQKNPGANPEAGFIASSNCATAIRARGKP